MSIFFSSSDRPCCKYCRQELPGYATHGHCPHCGHWYTVERATVAPGRTRALALLAHSRPVVRVRLATSWAGWAATLLLIGNAAIVILLGRAAIRSLYHACGMNW